MKQLVPARVAASGADPLAGDDGADKIMYPLVFPHSGSTVHIARHIDGSCIQREQG